MRYAYEVPNQPGVTPSQLRQQLNDHRVRSLSRNLDWSEGRELPLIAGTVHCVRLIDTHACLSAFGRTFTLESTYRRSYIRASLAVAEQRISFFFQESPEEDPILIDVRSFQLPEAVRSYDPNLAQDLLL
jgi:hypothetical protein